GTPKDPPRRRVTASLAHQNHGSGPGWRTTVRRVSQPPEAAKPLSGALGARFPPVHAPLHTKRPPPGNFPNAETPPPQSDNTTSVIRKRCAKCARKRLCSLPRLRPAAHWAFPSAPPVRQKGPAVRHAAWRRFAL